MSLLHGMTDMLKNDAVLEAAQDEMMFEEEIAMEADELIDTMVDGKAPFDDEISQMENEDEIEDQINDELEAEDNSIAKANEAAALTGNDFLKSLFLDTNDPITTKNGSIGDQDGTANHEDNYSDEDSYKNEAMLATANGSVGQKDSSANHDKNFSDEVGKQTDAYQTKSGSIGQQNSSANPAVESALFFGELMGEEVAMEGILKKFADKLDNKIKETCSKLGVQDVTDQIDDAMDNSEWKKAFDLSTSFANKLEAAKAKIDPEDTKLMKATNRLIKSYNSLSIKIKKDALVEEYMKNGMDRKEAVKKAKAQMKSKKVENPAVEAYIADCWNMIEAFEAACDNTDPGSIGQKDSSANPEKNFSDGDLDKDDPIKTEDGSTGQKDSAANHDSNFSDGDLDKNDPIDAEDGSVGQKDSSATPDVAKESTIEDELELMNDILDSDDDDDDDDEI